MRSKRVTVEYCYSKGHRRANIIQQNVFILQIIFHYDTIAGSRGILNMF